MPLTHPPRSGVRLLGVLLLLGATVVGVLVLRGVARRPEPARTPTLARSVIQGPQRPPATVVLADGVRLRCPRGAEPTVAMESVVFDPPLVGGITMRRGSYRIVARASVLNETDRPITVGPVTFLVGGRPWRAQVEGPRALPAEAKAPVVVQGTYRNARRGAGAVASRFSWQWREASLHPCGAKGLIEDD